MKRLRGASLQQGLCQRWERIVSGEERVEALHKERVGVTGQGELRARGVPPFRPPRTLSDPRATPLGTPG